MRAWLIPALALAGAAAIVVSQVSALGLALRLFFLLASAPFIGATLLLAIARLTGADWRSAAPASRGLVWFAPLGFVTMFGATGVPLPPQLALWSSPLAVAVRATVAVAALAWTGARLRAGASTTFAGVTLALYAALVTPLAADWLLPAAPGHPVSAIGMILFLIQFAAGCSAALQAAIDRQRRDLALLLVAAVIGLGYLGFVDYLIIWFGNLPARVPFYLERSGLPALAALIVGVGGTIAAIASGRLRLASFATALGLALFVWWWIDASLIGALLVAIVAMAAILVRRGAAHG